MNAILYVNRTGIPWEYLPHDFPPYKAVYDYYAKWAADGTTEQVHEADPTRREVLAIIVREGGASSTSLAASLPVTRQAVAKHLAVLERAGLVRPHRVGREVRYEADLQPLKRTRQWMDTLAAAW